MGARRSASERAWLLLLCPLFCVSCSAPGRPAWSRPDTSDWSAMNQRLAQERDARPHDPWAAVVSVTMREPRSGHVVDGRGAIAVAPGRAVRMILVGAAGLTLLDAWVGRDRWRIAVPPVQTVRRGGASDDPADLPVAFLRWWFCTPLEGELFAAKRTGSGTLWLLRDGDAVIELVRGPGPPGAGLLTATRRAHGRSEVVQECRAPTLRPGAWVEYKDESIGLGLRLVVESVAERPPEQDAFGDPDVQGGT